MQIVSSGDNLHEMSKPIFWEKKYFKMSSAESLPSMLITNLGPAEPWYAVPLPTV